MSEQLRHYDELYARFGEPFEENHMGEFLAISPTGETLVAKTLREAQTKGFAKFGHGIFVCKIGAKAVGWIR